MRDADDSKVLQRIESRVKEASRTLEKLGYKCQPISSKEFFDYMTGETPTGDPITVYDVLGKPSLMVHEVAEISELKRMNVPINKQTVTSFYPKVYEAHLVAMDCELTYALEKGDYASVKRVLHNSRLQENLDDPYLPLEFHYLRKELAPRFKSMIEKFSKAIEKQKS